MVKYLIVQLCDTSVSFCNYHNHRTEARLMPLDTLKRAIQFAMCENMLIQFVYPSYNLPEEYMNEIESIDHAKVAPIDAKTEADIVILNSHTDAWKVRQGQTVSFTISLHELPEAIDDISRLFHTAARVNIALSDAHKATDSDLDNYTKVLEELSDVIVEEYKQNHPVQFNMLTDRLLLNRMNNCNAGNEAITIAPDGHFYICPAFYLDGDIPVGNLDTGIHIPNQQLYDLNHATICSHCDAWHCRRCVWLNKKATLEVNTPSRGQCITAHTERKVSKRLYDKLIALPQINNLSQIPEIDYIDPFEKVARW